VTLKECHLEREFHDLYPRMDKSSIRGDQPANDVM